MQQADERLAQAFREVVLELADLDTDDQEAIVRIGAALEETIPNVSDQMTELIDLLNVSLEGLQAVYTKSVPNAKQATQLVQQAIATAERFLSLPRKSRKPALLTEAAQALSSAISTGNAVRGTEPVETGSPGSTTIHDAAALLVQLEPTDSADIDRLRNVLAAIAGEDSCAAAAGQMLLQAVQRLEFVAQGKASEPEAILAEVGKLIEQAADAMEEGENVSSEARIAARAEVTEATVSTVRAEAESPAENNLPPDADPDLLGEFITECREYIEGAEAALLSLESDPEDSEAVNTVFRAFHTIKGTSAFLGLPGISELAHLAESLLSRVRDHEIRCTGGYADLALRSVDALKELIQSVQDALGGAPMAKPNGLDELMKLLRDPEESGVTGESTGASDVPRLGDIPDSATLTDAAKAVRTQKKMATAEQAVESSVRIRTDRLDRLIDTVGELVIAQSMVAQDETVVLGGHYELAKKVTHAGKIVRELQYLSMSMRMVPLRATFQKMARLVRDVAHKSGKQVEFFTEGEDTEIDRNMVDVINDPLVHMVRNAVDHGIETPDARESKGKPRTGKVVLSAYHSGGNIVVEMQDDGEGLNREKIVQKAASKGLIESDKGLSDCEVYNLVFEPGFSTADKVTDISGRGVGLDVVKKGVEALRGHIDIASEPDKGCTFSVRLPLTLAVTDGMLVRVGNQRFIIPTINIHRSFRPSLESLSTVNGRGELVILRGELMPMSRLHRLFEIPGAVEDPTDGLLVIVGDGDRRCAILVDELLGQHQVVAKSLGEAIGRIQGISGGAILGDGRVGLILDTAGIAAMARQASAGPNYGEAALKLIA